jgi:mRNA-degrading endonuclease RelE of RelBE toxin-antitoxin system
VIYAVFLHPKAAKELNKLEARVREKLIEQANELRQTPNRAGKCISKSDFWSLRIGEYRAIQQIDNAKNRVVVLLVGHRGEVYDDFSKML